MNEDQQPTTVREMITYPEDSVSKQIVSLKKKINNLEDWKLSAIDVIEEWGKVGSVLMPNNPRLGESFVDCALKAARAQNDRIAELERICAESYQVAGVLASGMGAFKDRSVQKALDNLSQQRIVHEDVLPFEVKK